jgi:hypothetical protein
LPAGAAGNGDLRNGPVIASEVRKACHEGVSGARPDGE